MGKALGAALIVAGVLVLLASAGVAYGLIPTGAVATCGGTCYDCPTSSTPTADCNVFIVAAQVSTIQPVSNSVTFSDASSCYYLNVSAGASYSPCAGVSLAYSVYFCSVGCSDTTLVATKAVPWDSSIGSSGPNETINGLQQGTAYELSVSINGTYGAAAMSSRGVWDFSTTGGAPAPTGNVTAYFSDSANGLLVDFTDHSVVSNGATELSVVWTFGDGSGSVAGTAGGTVDHQYARSGSYNVTESPQWLNSALQAQSSQVTITVHVTAGQNSTTNVTHRAPPQPSTPGWNEYTVAFAAVGAIALLGGLTLEFASPGRH